MRLFTIALLMCRLSIAAEAPPKAILETPLVREGRFTLWHDPGIVSKLDFQYGAGGKEMVPQPPYTFVEEDTGGTNPKLKVRDANGRAWSVKFGKEARPDTFCTRMAWACGYYVEPTYFVAEGSIEGAHGLHRAAAVVDRRGRFQGGRFQLRAKEPKFLRTVDWSWRDNPFTGTPELSGLKILMMLVSNWDDKDSQDADRRGTNTAIFQDGRLMIYSVDDWGGAMGRWGGLLSRSKWDYRGFYEQSPAFISFTEGGIRWGYQGQHTHVITGGIRSSDVAWLLRYLGQVSDDQLREALIASGASGTETRYYVQGIRTRIRQLQKIAALSVSAN
ncbi:MAG: hypothetical protein U0Q18_17950 [Bryobacteraceae bacterium]